MKKNKVQEPKCPWINFYGDKPAHLNYFEGTIYEYLEACSRMHMNLNEYYGKIVNFRKFLNEIEEVAKALKAEGVNEGDRVTICMPNTPQGILMFYAVNKIGAVANMVHPLSSETEIEFYLNKANSKFVLTIDLLYNKLLSIIGNTKVEKIVVTSVSDRMSHRVGLLYWVSKGRKNKKVKLRPNDLLWNDFINRGKSYVGETLVRRNSNDEAVILYSGGTTGEPKGILLSNMNFNALANQAKVMATPNAPGDSILSIMPIFHGFGLAVCIHTTLCIGMKCILIPSFSSKKFGDLIKKYKPNFIVGVPTLFSALISNKKVAKQDLSFIKNIVCGGDQLQPDLRRSLENFLIKHGTNAKVKEGYGLTESTAAVCLTLDDYMRPCSIGVPFPDTYFKIVMPNTHDEVPYGEDGEICISGPTVMLGYLENAEETINTLRVHEDGRLWLHTASMDEDGFVYFKQRLKRVIVSSGYNIYPSYVERIINSHPAVLTSTVIGIKHPYKVQVAKAFIVLKEGIKPTNDLKNDIYEYCLKNIARYSMPYEIEYRETLPTTKVGKIAYRELEREEESKEN
jgi:long-chain acyl-CoA synthetase